VLEQITFQPRDAAGQPQDQNALPADSSTVIVPPLADAKTQLQTWCAETIEKLPAAGSILFRCFQVPQIDDQWEAASPLDPTLVQVLL
jgi:hypothetical protein